MTRAVSRWGAAAAGQPAPGSAYGASPAARGGGPLDHRPAVRALAHSAARRPAPPRRRFARGRRPGRGSVASDRRARAEAGERRGRGDRGLDDEDRAPVEDLGQRAADRRTGGGAGERRAQPQPAAGVRLARVEQREGGEQRGGAAHGLQRAEDEQDPERPGEAAPERGRREQREAPEARAVRAQPRGREDAQREHERVDADDRGTPVIVVSISARIGGSASATIDASASANPAATATSARRRPSIGSRAYAGRSNRRTESSAEIVVGRVALCHPRADLAGAVGGLAQQCGDLVHARGVELQRRSTTTLPGCSKPPLSAAAVTSEKICCRFWPRIPRRAERGSFAQSPSLNQTLVTALVEMLERAAPRLGADELDRAEVVQQADVVADPAERQAELASQPIRAGDPSVEHAEQPVTERVRDRS